MPIANKASLVLLIFTFLTSFISPSFAEYREDRDYFAGEIIAVSVNENKITIRLFHKSLNRS